jgi:hypothetical protein
MVELGYTGVDIRSWQGIVAPLGPARGLTAMTSVGDILFIMCDQLRVEYLSRDVHALHARLR